MKRIKKLLALALSGVMALSCTVLASATPATDYTGGQQTGVGEFESVLPDGTVRLVVPTLTDNMYDMILDPHSLIKETGAARYTPTGANAQVPTFEGEDDSPVYLFFRNTAQNNVDPEFDYSSKSNTADVVNKSSFEVDVKVSVEVDKGLAGSSFELVDKDAVADAEGAAMYLGLEVVDAESTTDSGTDTVAVVDGAEPQVMAVSLDEDADKVDAAPTATVAGVSIGSAVNEADKTKAKAIFSDVTVSFVPGASAADKAEVVKALTLADATASPAIAAAKVTAVYNHSTGAVTLTATIPTHAQIADIPETYTATTSGTVSIAKGTLDTSDPDTYTDAYFTMPVKKTVNSADVVVAKIRGKINSAEAVKVTTDDATAEITFASSNTKVAPLSSASYSKELGAYSSAYAYVFKNTSASDPEEGEYILAYYDTDTTSGFNNSATAAATKLSELEGSLEPAKALRFNLVGAINNSDDWDKLAGAQNNIDIAVIWDVSEAESRAKKPTLSVDAPITGSASSVVFTWTAGTGKYAGYAPKIGSGGAKYSKNGTATNLTTGTNTTPANSFKVNGVGSTVRVETSTNFVVVFECTGKDPIEVPFPSGWYS